MTHILADTLSCLTLEEAAQLGIDYLPQIIIFGDESYRDDTQMDSWTFVERLKASTQLPKTSAPYPTLYTPYFEKYQADHETILIICPSKKVSGTIRSAETAASDFPDCDIRIIDTALIGAGLGSVVRKAVEWVNAGLPADVVEQNILEMAKRNRTYFLVDTLEFLHKGGRIGTAKALVGSMLQMKPILAFRDGQVEAASTERTRKKALASFINLALQECPQGKESFFAAQHGGVPDQAQNLAQILAEQLGITSIPITFLPPAIIVHGGPGVLGISFFAKQ